MDPEFQEERRKQHAEVKSEVEKRLVANADNFDKAILTYSSAGLALSLGFLKDFVGIAEAGFPWLLFSSWALFLVSVLSTISSYLTSQLAQHRQLNISARYNIEMVDEALHEINWPARFTVWSSYVAGLCFIAALTGSTLFVSLNLPKGSKVAATNRGTGQDGAPVPVLQNIQCPELQKGAPVPIIQSIPQVRPGSIPEKMPAVVPSAPGSAAPQK